MGFRPGNTHEKGVDLSQKETIWPAVSEDTPRIRRLEENSRVETLIRRLEMRVFEGWNPEGWVFRAERFIVAHGMSKERETSNGNNQCRDGMRLLGFSGRKVTVLCRVRWNSKSVS